MDILIIYVIIAISDFISTILLQGYKLERLDIWKALNGATIWIIKLIYFIGSLINLAVTLYKGRKNGK